jgi:hypothetical protein
MIRFKVWMLLVLIALVALPLGVAVNRYRAEQGAIAQLRRLSARIKFEPGRLLGLWWPKVVGVEAHGREFSDEGLALLAGLPDLRRLSLFDTRTTDDGLAYLVRLRGLEVIYLVDTEETDARLRITEAGLDRLRRASPKLKIVQRFL